jgi:predicted PurR-regulated permease PerM
MEPRATATGLRVLLALACLVVVIAGLREASGLLVPVMVAAYLTVLSIAPVRALQRRGLPDFAAVAAVFSLVVLVMFGIGALVGRAIDRFAANLPEYQANVREQTSGLTEWLEQHELSLSSVRIREALDSGEVLGLAGHVVGAVGELLSNTAFVLITMVFMLAEAAGLPQKLRAAFGAHARLDRLEAVVPDIQRYLRLKTRLTIVTGVCVAIVTATVGLDDPALWGLLAFMFDYIPGVGIVLTVLPIALLTLVQFGWETAAIATGAIVLINMVVGNVLEPRLLGSTLGLSALVVFLSVVFWGFVLGPVGMILSVPLTMVVKMLLQQSEDLRFVAVLLGPGGSETEAAAAPAVAEVVEMGITNKD